MTEQKWTTVTDGLRAELWFKCPDSGEEGWFDFDARDLIDGGSETSASCDDCGGKVVVSLSAMVQHQSIPEGQCRDWKPPRTCLTERAPVAHRCDVCQSAEASA